MYKDRKETMLREAKTAEREEQCLERNMKRPEILDGRFFLILSDNI